MSAFDGLPQASFSGIAFPVEHLTLMSKGRQFLFEFPHQPGAAPEKLGRGIWMISVQVPFAQGLKGYLPTLYPNSMTSIRKLYEQQTTATLIHPTTGSFQAFISSWKQDYTPKTMRNGERVEIEFLEDQSTTFLTDSTFNTMPSTVQVHMAAVLSAQALIAAAQEPPVQSLFQALQATSNALSALSDQGNLYGSLVMAKATQLSNLCDQIDHLPFMQLPTSLSVLDPLHDLWATSTAFLTPPAQPLTKWVVPTTMSIQQVADFLFGDLSQVSMLQNLNAAVITNPSAIKAGTQLQYFAAKTTS